MSTPLPLILGLLGAGAVGAITATLLQPAPAPAGETGAIGRTATNAAGLEELTTELAQLSRRLEVLETAPPTSVRQAAIEAPLVIDDEKLEQAVAAALSEQPGGKAGVETLVADTLDFIRAKEEAEEELAREQRRLDAIQRNVDRLAERLELYGDQPEQLFGVLSEESARRDELRDLMRDGQATFDDMRALRDETQTQLGQILTADQLAKYEELNDRGGRGNRGGGGPGGGGL